MLERRLRVRGRSNVVGKSKTYLIGWCLLAACLACWTLAAVYFELTDHDFIISTLLQTAGVFLALAIAYFFFEHRSQVRQKKIDLTVDWTVDRLRNLAQRAVTTTVKQWQEHPYRHSEYGTHPKQLTYEEARKFVLERSLILEEYPCGIDSFGSLYYVFQRFEELAWYCAQTFRTVGSTFVEYGLLVRAMITLEDRVEAESRVWEEFRKRMESPNSPLSAEASYNLFVIAEVAVHLVDVLDSENFSGDPEYEARRKYVAEVIRRSNEWGEWR